MSLCDQCVAGVRHEGVAEGIIEQVGGVDSYIATPKGDYDQEKVILYLIDIYGIDLPNHQLLADDYARNGFKVIVPDILHGDPCPPNAQDPGSGFDLKAWLAKHPGDSVLPVLDRVLGALRESGVKKIAAVGFCYGARPAFDLAFQNITAVTVISHPSLLKVPEDYERYASSSQAPILINSCEIDHQLSRELQPSVDEILKGHAPGYKRTYFEGCTHGFTIRGDLSNPKVKEGKEGAFKETVDWLRQHL